MYAAGRRSRNGHAAKLPGCEIRHRSTHGTLYVTCKMYVSNVSEFPTRHTSRTSLLLPCLSNGKRRSTKGTGHVRPSTRERTNFSDFGFWDAFDARNVRNGAEEHCKKHTHKGKLEGPLRRDVPMCWAHPGHWRGTVLASGTERAQMCDFITGNCFCFFCFCFCISFCCVAPLSSPRPSCVAGHHGHLPALLFTRRSAADNEPPCNYWMCTCKPRIYVCSDTEGRRVHGSATVRQATKRCISQSRHRGRCPVLWVKVGLH